MVSGETPCPHTHPTPYQVILKPLPGAGPLQLELPAGGGEGEGEWAWYFQPR